MSDAIETESAPPRDWRLYVNDMIEFSEKVAAYTEGLDKPHLALGELEWVNP